MGWPGPGPHPAWAGAGGHSGSHSPRLRPAVSARRRRRKRVYHLGDLDCCRLKFNPRCGLSLAMLFKHIKGHKKIPMARVVPTQARRESEFDSGGFPEPGFRVRGEEGAEKKENCFPSRTPHFPKQRGKPSLGRRERRAPCNSGKTSSGKRMELQHPLPLGLRPACLRMGWAWEGEDQRPAFPGRPLEARTGLRISGPRATSTWERTGPVLSGGGTGRPAEGPGAQSGRRPGATT